MRAFDIAGIRHQHEGGVHRIQPCAVHFGETTTRSRCDVQTLLGIIDQLLEVLGAPESDPVTAEDAQFAASAQAIRDYERRKAAFK